MAPLSHTLNFYVRLDFVILLISRWIEKVVIFNMLSGVPWSNGCPLLHCYLSEVVACSLVLVERETTRCWLFLTKLFFHSTKQRWEDGMTTTTLIVLIVDTLDTR